MSKRENSTGKNPSGQQGLNDYGYQPKGDKTIIQDGYQPTLSLDPSNPPTGGSGVSAKPASDSKK